MGTPLKATVDIHTGNAVSLMAIMSFAIASSSDSDLVNVSI